jgi:hypothetical protein
MSEWIDLQDAVVVAGFALHSMTTINAAGVGKAIYVQMIDSVDGEFDAYLLSPDFALRLGHELVAVAAGFQAGVFALDVDNDFDDDDDDDPDDLDRLLYDQDDDEDDE